MRQFSLWIRERPMFGDSLLALLLFGLECASGGVARNLAVYIGVGAIIALPVAWRRVRPRAAAVAVIGTVILAMATIRIWHESAEAHPGQLSTVVILYTLVAYVNRRVAAGFAAITAALTLVSYPLGQGPSIPNIAFSLLFCAVAWLAAEFVGSRHAYDEAVAARLRVAEFERDRKAEDAVAAERTRIARELHDVVAHSVSVMIVQADGAGYALRANPEAAATALANISATGRQALTELRRTVSLLRTDATSELPQHGTAGLAHVVELMRQTGLAVNLEMTGELDDIPPALSLGIHRIVQESLTNVLRHAGPQPTARVTVTRREDDVVVTIEDDGNRTGLPGPPRTPGSGNGLLGMRERVAVLRGTLEMGRRRGGGWRVHAELPLQVE